MLNTGLAKLGSIFGLNVVKSLFPHKFFTKDNLCYRGDTPDISFYDNITQKEYLELYTPEWSFKEVSLNYLFTDVNSLYEVL